MRPSNAVEWHTHIAREFAQRYANKASFIERYAVWTDLIDAHSGPDNVVLDVGCGSGVFSFYAAGRNASVVGIDASEEMIAICRERADALGGTTPPTFVRCELERMGNLIDRKADLILCSSVLEYVDDLDAAMQQLVSLLKKDGVLIFSMPNGLSIYRRLEDVVFRLTGRPVYYRYVRQVSTLEKLKPLLSAVGLTVADCRYYAKMPIVSDLLRRIGRPQYADKLLAVVAGRR